MRVEKPFKSPRTLLKALLVGLLALPPLAGTGQAQTTGLVDEPVLGSALEECEEHELHDQAETAATTDLQLPSADVDNLLLDIYEVFAGLPGFIDVYYYPGDAVEYRPMFVKEVPLEAIARSTPVPVAFDILPEAPVALGAGTTPDANDLRCIGLRPGTRISTPIGICTTNFVFTDATTTYIGTAGHCGNVGQYVTANLFAIGSAPTIGQIVYSSGSGGVGNDFALIEVASGWLSYVTPEMCDWAGPTGTFTGSSITGQATVQTGHGGGSVAAPPRPKPGVGLSWGATSFTWAGTSVPGDSGSGIRLESGAALGTVTHLSLVIPVQNFGTRWDRGLSMAAGAGFTGLTLETVAWTHP